MCKLPGSHLRICDPVEFYRAWEALGDLSDEDCERWAARLERRVQDGDDAE